MKPKYFILLCLSVYVLSTQYSTATVRYVSKTGSSTPPYTTWQTAADSIQKCINICVDGDTVYVANGVYKENLVINTQIFLSGLSMDSTLIDGTGLGDYTITFNKSGTIKEFQIYGKGKEVLTSRVIRSNTQFTIVEIKNCKLSEAGVGVSMIGGDVKAENLIINNVTRGFNLFGEVDNNISNCTIFLESDNSIGISVGLASNVTFHFNNNIIIFSTINTTIQYGIYLGLPRKVNISNNIISGFTDNIFVDDVIDTVFINNNVLANQKEKGTTASILGTGDIINVNNVILKNNDKAIYGGLINSNYNIFWENIIDLITLSYGDGDRVADPMFVSDTIPMANGGYDFHLQAYSPGIDKGSPAILDLDGTRSDIGIYGGPFGETYTYQDLAPLAPRNPSAIVDSNNIMLKWNRNTEADTSYYKVYRDTVVSFQIDSTKLISSQTDTFFIQTLPQKVSKYVYKITCVDNQGNESKPSEEVVVDLTSVSTDSYPMIINDYLLYQNYPNPFNPSTKIGYKLKARGYVKLMVYDIKGELVSVLVNKEQDAGYYEVDFNVNGQRSNVKGNLASGIYLYRIEVIDEDTIPVYTEMKKMLMIK